MKNVLEKNKIKYTTTSTAFRLTAFKNQLKLENEPAKPEKPVTRKKKSLSLAADEKFNELCIVIWEGEEEICIHNDSLNVGSSWEEEI